MNEQTGRIKTCHFSSQVALPLDHWASIVATPWNIMTRTQETIYRDSHLKIETNTKEKAKCVWGQVRPAQEHRLRSQLDPNMNWKIDWTTQWPMCSSFIPSFSHPFHACTYMYISVHVIIGSTPVIYVHTGISNRYTYACIIYRYRYM